MSDGRDDARPNPPSSAPLEVWRGWSAERTLSSGQRVAGSVTAVAVLAGLALATSQTLVVLIGVLTVVFFLTTALRLVYYMRGARAEAAPGGEEALALDRAALPRYTVLVALYREAAVVPALLDALAALDYPGERLQVLLLLEEDDSETRERCDQLLRPGWRVVVVPDGSPRTKPRALNAGLALADGELLTIFDAEDRPDADQLRRAAGAFTALPPRVGALQAKLDYYNANTNLLTRWFTCEYASHFGLALRGIARSGHAMPLGGTSTHFRTDTVRALGGWDSWNVTEDCELGMRLAAAGYDCLTLDSVTPEEAVSEPRAWVRQRSRWVKGYTQTALAMTRRPWAAARAMGLRRYLAALLTVGGTPVVLLAQPVFWALLWVYVALRAAGVDVTGIERLFPEPLLTLGLTSLLVGNFAVLLAQVAVVYQQRRYRLVRDALFIPIYWLLGSVGAWKALAQLVRRPHYWEKTAHGGAADVAPQPLAEAARPSRAALAPQLDPPPPTGVAER